MSSYHAVFRCAAGCAGDISIWQPIYHCPTCGGLLQVVHDLDALRDRSAAAWMRTFEERYKRTTWPYGSGRVGQEGVGLPGAAQREHRVDGRGRHQHVLGRTLRPRARARRPVGQAVRQLAHRIVQGSRDDGAGVGRQADDRQRLGRPGGGVRVDRRHLRLARGVRRGRGAAGGRDPAARQGHRGAAGPAAGQRRPRPRARHRLRRLHGDRQAAGRGGRRLPRELDEQPAHRGAEDAVDRDRPAVRLGGPGL